MPLVSVIIPTYNHAHFLGRALQSVIDQTYLNWEAIVIDNHSTDNTDEVLRYFTDERIKIFKIQNNGVIAASRNMGILAAKGELIAFLDSDDWWVPSKLLRCIQLFDDSVDIVYHHLYVKRSYKHTRFNQRIVSSKPTSPVFLGLLANGMSIPNSSVLVRKDLLIRIGGISESLDLISVEDYDTWIRLSKLTERFICIPEFLGYYWGGGGNISAASPIQVTRITTLYSQYIDELQEKDRLRAEYLLNYRIARIQHLYGSHKEAREKYLKSICSSLAFVYRVKACYFYICSILSAK